MVQWSFLFGQIFGDSELVEDSKSAEAHVAEQVRCWKFSNAACDTVDFNPTITETYIYIYGSCVLVWTCIYIYIYIYPCYTHIYIYYKTWFGACDNGRLSEIIHVCL